ncbi:MAG: ParB N-terminal domain-containing protein [Anaerolineae bacterium]|jgi:ParB-like chromosome segregation protein Spo0J|nr:ParB N-terminal domain-containing protein [Anaerolineae bacterium]
MGNKRINENLLGDVALDMFGDDEVRLHDDSLRVEYILLDLVRPDPVQPRRVLPEHIYWAFHSQQITPSQALRELIQSAQLVAQQQGRPFTNVLDLLGNEDEELPHFSPEEQLVRDLVNLAVTIRDDGQVNPLTVVEVSQGVVRQYRIETGERRYWATWLLRDYVPGYESDGTIPCIIITSERSSAFRQARENTARSGLSAIALARQAALLLLAVHGYDIPDGPVPLDFYRQALDLDLRNKREFTADILAAMGGMSRHQFSRYKLLLRLSDEALELADQHHLDEGLLRPVIGLPVEQHADIVQQIIQQGLTVRQVNSLCSGDELELGEADPIPKHMRQLVRVLRTAQSAAPDQLAQLLLEQEQDRHLARARLQSFRQLLDEAEAYLE